MNNKGQTLVLFLFIIPIIFLVIMALYQYGSAELEKKQIESAVKDAIQYGMDYKEEENIEEQMITMFQKNFPKISKEYIEIKIDEEVRMVVKKEYAILFFARPLVRVSYVGKNIDGKVQIIKE